MKNKTFSILIITLLLMLACDKEKSKKEIIVNKNIDTETKTNQSEGKNQVNVKVGDKKEKLKAYYELDYIKEFYEWDYKTPPELNYNQDLTKLSYEDLRLLRNEIFARNGYLFSNGFLRGYFNKQKWYRPIFDVPDFKIELSGEQQKFINKILTEEKKRKLNKTILKNKIELSNIDLLVNKKQFKKIPSRILNDLKNQNFSIVSANRSMPFFAYDKNAYQYIPHYITTDLYLFILHKYFSKTIEKLDENFMHKSLKRILKNTNNDLNKINNETYKSIVNWSKMYNSLALYTIGDSLVVPPNEYATIFKEEIKNIDNQNGNSLFIPNPFVNYKELKPRGHYTKSEKLKKYFKTFKLMSLNGIDLKNDKQFKGLLLFAYTIKKNSQTFSLYKKYIKTMEKLAGKEDNLSIFDIIKMVETNSIEELLSNKNIESVRFQLNALNKERVKIVLGRSLETEKRVYFLSSTYSISGEIFSNLVHIDQEKSKRPYPRGLDVPAVFGNKTAENIIINEYKDTEVWQEYTSKLRNLQDQFKSFNDWNHNYGFKGVQTALDASAEQDNYPDFMKTDAYNRKELSTTLSSWTHIKHDLILYQEKPFAAEGGQGGGPEPPEHFSYVEPNLKFWNTAEELVLWLEKFTVNDDTYEDELNRIKELGTLLKKVAQKQIHSESVTKEEFNELHYIGGTIEYILLGLLETDHLPDREKSMALIADVYSYKQNLNVAVGHADDIYVVVPYKNEYYIARGSVFSYYEFKGEIYNDEQWKEKANNNNLPNRPKWLESIINNEKPLEGQLEFRYVGDNFH